MLTRASSRLYTALRTCQVLPNTVFKRSVALNSHIVSGSSHLDTRPHATLPINQHNNPPHPFRNMSTAATSVPDQFLAPEGQKVCKLECKDAFATLTDKEALYAHYFGKGMPR
eukprot:TRINITY_DN5047_c0_g2_i1.p1 TRINITY_DN5047_c0_g2~~TRINITY_DN5047_c0_g2_i1.p1  ORF type:complete len:113 (+),score=10.77 TRINITY_DN5047_c0_g2_i1:38-376(+)